MRTVAKILRSLVLLISLPFTTTLYTSAQQQAVTDSLLAVAQHDSSNWQALSQLAMIYKERQDTYHTLHYLQKALAIHRSDTLRRELAVCYYNRGYYKQAAEISKSLLYPDTLEKDLVLITRALKKMSGTNAGDLLLYEQILFEKNPLNWQNTSALASNYLEISSLVKDKSLAKEAVAMLEQYYAVDSTNININTVRARAFYAVEDYEKTISVCNDLIKMGSRTPMTYVYLGLAYEKDFNVWKGIECLEVADSLADRANPSIVTYLGNFQLKVDSLAERGVANILRAVELRQPDPETLYSAYYNIAEYYFRHSYKNQKNAHTAIKYYNMARECGGHDKQIAMRISSCYSNLKDDNKLIEYLSKAMELTDDSAEAEYLRLHIDRLRKEMFMKGDLKK